MAQAELSDSRNASGLIRMVIFGGALVIILAIIGALIWGAMSSSRGQPISYEVFPGAAVVEQNAAGKTDRYVYTSSAAPQEVLNFYASKITRTEENGCIQTAQNTNVYARCVVDNSFNDVSQRLEITIRTGANGGSVIEVDRVWG